MKKVYLGSWVLAVLLTFQAQAGIKITCTNLDAPKYTFILEEIDFSHYFLSAFELESLIFTDFLEYNDIQGAGIFKSQHTYINMEDTDKTFYSFEKEDQNGKFVHSYAYLKCQ
jgi:hypothetical protein